MKIEITMTELCWLEWRAVNNVHQTQAIKEKASAAKSYAFETGNGRVPTIVQTHLSRQSTGGSTKPTACCDRCADLVAGFQGSRGDLEMEYSYSKERGWELSN